ncbi:unnamed protein product [Peronospora destructor]|uniref:PUM-HD domain-containing protein n=1 Tax=Peronospora destructor TaxID=86335 RepID=A0AAV0TJ77_9STRA|nr:unnamed protein product [Peronospora destructor]
MTIDFVIYQRHPTSKPHVMGHSDSMSPVKSGSNGGPCSSSSSFTVPPQRVDSLARSAITTLEKPVHHDDPVEPVRVKLQDPIGYTSDFLWSSEGLKSRSSLLFTVSQALGERPASVTLRPSRLQSKADLRSVHSAQTTPPSESDEGEVVAVDNQKEDHDQQDANAGELSTSWETMQKQSSKDNQPADNQELESLRLSLNVVCFVVLGLTTPVASSLTILSCSPVLQQLGDRERVLSQRRNHQLVDIWKNPHNDFEDDNFIPSGSPTSSPEKQSFSLSSTKAVLPRSSRGDTVGCRIPPGMSLIDRIQEDFPRTPSPEYGQLEDGDLPIRKLSFGERDRHDQSVFSINEEMEQLKLGNYCSARPYDSGRWSGHAFGDLPRMPKHTSDPNLAGVNNYRHAFGRSASEPPFGRSHHEAPAQGYPSPYGMEAQGVQSYPIVMGSAKSRWGNNEDTHSFPSSPFGYAPSAFAIPHPVHGSAMPAYPVSYAGGYRDVKYADKMPKARPSYPLVDYPPYELHDFGSYIPRPQMLQRLNVGEPWRNDFEYFHPVAHSYSSNSLLEEFNSAPKSEKWGLSAIKGHLFLFAKDQTGSRFIQQKLEKADERLKADAFNEIFPNSLLLMTDVFGNYVIQKFLEFGSLEQQQLLVELMTSNMISLALQVYGCRVIQRALEVVQVEEQLALIRQLKGHVMKCVIDQNGNHVLQKCIEAASWKRAAECNGMGPQLFVTGKDIQFIIDSFVGHAAALSTHSYGCRVIQRVLEHCAPEQICPLLSEIIFKCRELVKDQFGNYVVQHVISHGEPNQRNIVMQAVLPEIARWSQHKYASNVVESCLEHATKEEVSRIIDFILQCDESGASCALLPMMKHMYGNYVVQKLLERADDHDRQRIVCIIRHNEDYLKRFTFGKHVLSRLEREEQANQYF